MHIHEGGGKHHNKHIFTHLFPRMCRACNESLVGRLEEGGMDENGGEEVEDNCEVHKETIYATRYLTQTRGEGESVDACKTQIWIELHNGELVIVG
jgi:hypothetical protein